MGGRIINGEYFVELMDSNELKNESLENHIYFTLRDIFWNSRDIQDVDQVNSFNHLLKSNDCLYTEKGCKFSNVLNDPNSDFTIRLHNYLKKFKQSRLYFIDQAVAPKNDDDDEKEYLKLEVWWDQLQNLIAKLEERINKHQDQTNEHQQ